MQVRQFLYDEIGASQLFAGDGFGREDDGSITAREYLADNLKLSVIPGCVLVDLHVT